MSLNQCNFIGHLTRDPELKYLGLKGTAVVEFGIALNHRYTSDGEKREEVTFLDLEAWGKTAEIIGEHLKKGSQAHFTCRAKVDTWDDKATGAKRSKVKFVVDQMVFVDGIKQDGTAPKREPEQRARQYTRPATTKDPYLDASDDGSEIPF